MENNELARSRDVIRSVLLGYSRVRFFRRRTRSADHPGREPGGSELNYGAADALLARTPWLKERREPLLAATFVDINNLETSSGLGRVIGEQIGSRFAQQGFTVIEIKMRNNIFVAEGTGELMLSRSVKEISQSHNAAAVIAGTYAVARQSVYVNARLIRATDNLVLAAYDYVLPYGPDAKALVATQ